MFDQHFREFFLKLMLTFRLDANDSGIMDFYRFFLVSNTTIVLRVGGKPRDPLVHVTVSSLTLLKRRSQDPYIIITHALSFFVELIATEDLLKKENAIANSKINGDLHHPEVAKLP